MTAAMHLVYLINSFVEDGPGVVMAELLPELRRATGWPMTVAALRHDGDLRPRLEAAGITCAMLRNARRQPPGWWGGWHAAHALLASLRVPPRALVTVLPRADIIGRLASSAVPGLRVIAHEHGTHAWDEKGRLPGLAMRMAYRATLPRCHAVVAVSGFVAESLIARGVPAPRVHVIRNPVNVSRFPPPSAEARAAARRLFVLPPEARVLGCAGQLRSIKGQDVLIEAWAQFLAGAPRDASSPHILLFLGQGPQSSQLQQQVRQLGLASSVRFLPPLPHEEVVRFYHALDAYCQPSRMETFGLAAAEAASTGLPVVATAVGGLPETLADTPVLLCPPQMPAAMAEAISQAFAQALAPGPRTQPEALRELAPPSIAYQWSTFLRAMVP